MQPTEEEDDLRSADNDVTTGISSSIMTPSGIEICFGTTRGNVVGIQYYDGTVYLISLVTD